jgi:hypothetical protein
MRRQKSKKFVKNEDNKIIIAAKKKGKNLKIALQFLDYILPRDLIEFFLKKLKDEIGKNICVQKENFALLKWFHQRERAKKLPS